MNVLKKIINLPPLINFGLGIGLVISAYIFEIFGYYDPCPLCILQRWSFVLIAMCGALIAIPVLHVFLKKVLFILASFFACCGGIIAGRQIYLQNLPSDQIPTCAPPMDFLMDTLPLFEVIQTILIGDGNCAEYEWRFILNFAEWALVFFILLFIYNIFFLLKKS